MKREPTLEEAMQWYKKLGSLTKTARHFGITRRIITRIIQSGSAPTKRPGRSMSEFRSTFDKATVIPERIKKGLSALGRGWMYELEFSREYKISLPDLRLFSDQFSEYIVELRGGRRAWAGSPAMAQEMREIV